MVEICVFKFSYSYLNYLKFVDVTIQTTIYFVVKL